MIAYKIQNMDLNQLFIRNLKKWRKIKGVSQKELAEKCNSGHSYIRQLECGVGTPSFAFVAKIADALNIEPYQLFFDESAKTAKTARVKHMEITQKKLMEEISSKIQSAFDDLRKY